ncbi:AAA family ATPase, partial [Patulibacter brassicae]
SAAPADDDPRPRARRDRGAHRPPDAPVPTGAAARRVDEAAFAAALADLDALVGLDDVKRQVHRTAQLLRMRALREAAGLRAADTSLHLVFCGGPGTGKTTVARLYGRLYHALGLFGSDRLVEVDRSGLVSGYVGQTATRVNEVVDAALDGVLFVDEAYALAGRSPGDFGPEAIATLLKRMEDDRDRLAVICAGYTREMEEFLASNSGLASRFGETVVFPDYEPADLVEILQRFGAAHDYVLDGAALSRAREVLSGWHAARDASFANARTVRNLFDDVIAAQADRLLTAAAGEDGAARHVDPEEMRRIRRADVDAAVGT